MSSHTSSDSHRASDPNPNLITRYSRNSLEHPAIQSDDQLFEDPIDMFWDPLDDEPSDIESFGVDDMYGSDSDAEIIWTRPHTEDEPSSSDDQFILVCLFLETHYF